MTGAAIPKNCDYVIRQEDVKSDGENIFYAVKNFSDVDLILTESRTKYFFPAIFLYRTEKIFDEKIVAAFSSEEIFKNVGDAIKIVKFLSGK